MVVRAVDRAPADYLAQDFHDGILIFFSDFGGFGVRARAEREGRQHASKAGPGGVFLFPLVDRIDRDLL